MPFTANRFDDWVEYIPDIGDNRLEVEPMTVEIQAMTTAEYKAVQRSWGPKLQGKNALGRAQRMVDKILRDRVRNVRLFFVEDHLTGDVSEVTDLDEVLRLAPAELQDDLFEAITKASHLSAGLRKKSQRQSGSFSVETQPSAGTAETANVRAASKPDSPADKPYDSSEGAKVRLAQT